LDASWSERFCQCDALLLTDTWTFVVMPDHIHWLFELTGRDDLSDVMARVKSMSARNVNLALGRSGAIWQPGFHDHRVRREERLAAIARYVVRNPVRAGLVTSVQDYPLWHARWL
jgi:REP element-mobilizing transposase RayT